MEAKYSSQMGYFWRFFFHPMFANCVHTKKMFVHVSEREIFFSLNCSKFAVECDWSGKNSQNVQKFGFFLEKYLGFFEEKPWNFSESLHVTNFFWNASLMVFFLENVFPPYFWRFLAKIRENLKLEKLEKN